MIIREYKGLYITIRDDICTVIAKTPCRAGSRVNQLVDDYIEMGPEGAISSEALKAEGVYSVYPNMVLSNACFKKEAEALLKEGDLCLA